MRGGNETAKVVGLKDFFTRRLGRRGRYQGKVGADGRGRDGHIRRYLEPARRADFYERKGGGNSSLIREKAKLN